MKTAKRIFSLVLLVVLASSIIQDVKSHGGHRCNHDKFIAANPQTRPSAATKRSQNYAVSKAQLARMPRAQQQAQFSPLRVTFINDVSLNNLTQAQQAEVNKIYADLMPIVARLLSVVRVSGNLKATSDTCGTYALSQSLVTTGLADTDIGVILAYGGADSSGTVCICLLIER